MPVGLNRKRSRLALDPDDEDEPFHGRELSPALSAFSDTLKRSKTQCELDELGTISSGEAWKVDVDAILASKTLATPSVGTWEAHNNRPKYSKQESIYVLCVQGNVRVHYDLLCSALPDLYTTSPALQAFILCHDPSTHIPSSTAPFSLPLIQAVNPSNNHFVRLGLLHPLGGGKLPLDALVVVDKHGRRRLVLPFGWGAGKHAGTPAGRNIQTQLMALLKSCIETLEQEQ